MYILDQIKRDESLYLYLRLKFRCNVEGYFNRNTKSYLE